MAKLTAKQRQWLMTLLAQPTAPFHEQIVIETVVAALSSAGVPMCEDPIGNIVVGVASQKEYARLVRTKSDEPVRLFIAHMDHPGFHGVEWLGPRRLSIKWHGGSPVRHLNGARVWLANSQGMVADGTLARVKLLPNKRALDTAEVQVSVRRDGAILEEADALFGGLGFRAPVWQQGQKIYTKAADDLVGVFCIVALAQTLFAKKSAQIPFLGLLTRAEEVGFIGAIGHFDLGWVHNARRPVMAVSLEASRTLPNAMVGKGPVVRLGDRRTVFNADGLRMLTDIAEKILPGKHQRRIMDGGACEGSAATAYGIPTIALSVPLGNYHNQGFEGGPDCAFAEGPAPEFVHLDDIAGQLALCKGIMREGLSWQEPWAPTRRALRKNFRHYQDLL